ncbi:MAG: hypothetical protein ACI4WV_00015 [Eubacteriales bacterium]
MPSGRPIQEEQSGGQVCTADDAHACCMGHRQEDGHDTAYKQYGTCDQK